MKPKWQKLASLAQEIYTLWFQFFGAVFASNGYPFKNIFEKLTIDSIQQCIILRCHMRFEIFNEIKFLQMQRKCQK